ncbi:YlbD family protein [Bacillus sp. Bva_UNVM-123]|uniref:YlbD family protein n=1 Tax=Bacillus sp. Bva_UNVM-123 TaxID=2829798 RepID=UPI00391EEBA9
MATKELHPSVEQFKQFVKANPAIIKDVRSGQSTLQELYEDWYLLGEDDPKWDPYRTGEPKDSKSAEQTPDWMSNILGSLKKMEPNQMQGYIDNLSKTLATVQNLLSQFQGGNQVNLPKGGGEKLSNPFSFNKD